MTDAEFVSYKNKIRTELTKFETNRSRGDIIKDIRKYVNASLDNELQNPAIKPFFYHPDGTPRKTVSIPRNLIGKKGNKTIK